MSRDLQTAIREAKAFFGEGPRIQYEKSIGEGASGQTLRFKEMLDEGGERRFAVKMSIDETVDEEVIREINWLNILRNCSHIVQLIAVKDNFGRTRETLADSDMGPFMIMEYLENGTLVDFLLRVEGGPPLPDVFLLSIFLCLVRACLDMAYNRGNIPQPQDAGAYDLSHGDMHPGNLVFGDFDPSSLEHHMFPILKLIDFGRSELGAPTLDPDLVDIYTDEEFRRRNDVYTKRWRLQDLFASRRRINRNEGVEHNIRAIGLVMIRVIARNPDHYTLIQARDSISRDFVGSLDAEIRTLVARCLSPLPEYRPTLDELATTLYTRLAAIPWPQPGPVNDVLHSIRQVIVNG